MKKLLIISILFLSSITTICAQNNFTVVIDAGHGGHDAGAVGYAGVLEKDVTLAIAIKLKGELKKRGITTILTRQEDKFIPLKPIDKRSQIANSVNASVFISIHLNAGTFSGAGAECYVSKHRGADANKRKSVILSETILSSLKNELGFKNRGTQFADFSVLRNTIEYCPSILLELGFVSNKNELDFILGNGANLIAMSIAEAVANYKSFN